MKILAYLSMTIVLMMAVEAKCQTIDCDALKDLPAGVIRDVHEIGRHVNLSAEKQLQVAKMVMENDSLFAALISKDGGVLTNKSRNAVDRHASRRLAQILTSEELEQYYRGVFDAEANAEGIRVANTLQKKYKLTDQNWKFIRIAFYKIALEEKVVGKVMADKPKEAKKRLDETRKYYLDTIEKKGGIRVNAAGTTVTEVVPFDANALH